MALPEVFLNSNLVVKLLVVIIFVLKCFTEAGRECIRNVPTKGYTEPQGDISIEYGNPLDIICSLNEEHVGDNLNASAALKFVRNGKELPSEMIEVLNSSSIRLHVEKPPKMKNTYYTCMYGANDPVCVNVVNVGTKPLPVNDFECVGYNYDSLTCTWSPPENYIKTDYNLTYIFPSRSSRYGRNTCAVMTYPEDELGKMSCFWNVSTTPQYRQVHADYVFTLTMRNVFGTTQMNKTFKHFQHVLPGPPENLTYNSTTPESVYLHWSVPLSMQTFPYILHHRVLYQCEYDKGVWHLAKIIKDGNKKEVFYNLTSLKYAHALYDIRVSMRSSEALPTDESMWSKNASITVRTSSKPPGAPPRTNIGSFEIVSAASDIEYRDANVYWQQIPEEIKNGADFTYNITGESGSRQPVYPDEITKAYAKFKNLSIRNSYRFAVWSQNSDGASRERSHVYIPRQSKKINEPQSFTKIAFGDGRYELTWEVPKDQHDPPITNYTIFWCNHDRDRPYQCLGQLDWVEVPNNLTAYNVTVPESKIYQFAISANTEEGSSGMLWASCTVIHNKNIGKMKTVWIINIGSTFIELGWKLDCSDRIGRVNGFIIYYCPIVSPSQTDCKGPQRNHTVYGNSNTNHGNITDLTPYTTYMLTVAVITKHTTYSQQSDPLYNTTLEAAPSSPPLNVSVVSVTNSSITISWSPPNSTNGILKYYELKYNNGVVKIDQDKNEYIIKNLSSFANYKISMKACTIFCSEQSDVLAVTTNMGYPEQVKQPTISYQNNTYTIIIWDKPANPNGKIDFYDVLVTKKLQNRDNSTELINVSTPQHVENCEEDNKYDKFSIQVRAVNLIGKKRFEGSWSDPLEFNCNPTPPKFILFLVIPAIVVGLCLMVYLGRKFYRRCQIMRNVEVKLPPGLATAGTTELVPWGEQKIHEPGSSPDAESLLGKMGELKQLSGDSSGCSSGHESVSSESGSNLSSGTSDSGTEQPRSPSSDEIRRNSLRLRNNVASARPANKSGYFVMPTDAVPANWSPKPVLGGNYCVLGVDPNPVLETSTDYLPIACQIDGNLSQSDASSRSPPYVVTGDITKHINPGYIPYNQPPAERNPAYVVAGNKNVFLPASAGEAHYLQVADLPSGALKIPEANSPTWQQQQPTDASSSKTGDYVSVGQAMSPKITTTEHGKGGYVPHRHYESKPYKED